MLPVSTWMVRAADLAPSSSFDPPWLSAPVPAYSLLRLQHHHHYYHHHHHPPDLLPLLSHICWNTSSSLATTVSFTPATSPRTCPASTRRPSQD